MGIALNTTKRLYKSILLICNTSRYISSGVDGCHFLVDLETTAETALEPAYARDAERWQVVSELPFLDAAATPSVWRPFYVPHFGPKNSVYSRYLLLENRQGCQNAECNYSFFALLFCVLWHIGLAPIQWDSLMCHTVHGLLGNWVVCL